MLTGFPRTVFGEDAYNQRQETTAVSRRSACSVGLGQAGYGVDRVGGRKLGVWTAVCEVRQQPRRSGNYADHGN
jgi:hypothetical protein